MRLHLLIASAIAASAVQAQEYLDYRGSWQGPLLFSHSQEKIAPSGAPAVHPATLEIARDGSVRGQVPGAGCTLMGSSTEFVSGANASLDISFSGCRDARFNGRFSGRLINNPALKYASLRLHFTRSLDSGTAQVSAILRR